MFCGNCGKQIEDGAAFCPYCGWKVEQDSELEQRPDSERDPRPDLRQDTETEPIPEQEQESVPGSEHKNNDRNSVKTAPVKNTSKAEKDRTGGRVRPIPIAAAVVGVAAIVGAGLFFSSQNRKSANNGLNKGTGTNPQDSVSAAGIVPEDGTNSEETIRTDAEEDETGAGTAVSAESGDVPGSLKVREDVLSAIRSSSMISEEDDFGITTDGTIYCSKYSPGTAYAYYGKDIRRLFHKYAVTADGNMYDRVNLITDKYDIISAIPDTTSEEVVYLLTSDGDVLSYDEETDKISVLLDDGSATALLMPDAYAPTYSRSTVHANTLFFGRKRVAIPMSFGSDELQDFSSDTFDLSSWKNIVVAAGANNADGEWTTLAGIDNDGKVYTSGTYADDIRGMGELSYIDMADDGAVIVGLTQEGTLKFAGGIFEDTLKGIYSIPEEIISMSGITGLRVTGNLHDSNVCVYLREEDGNIVIWKDLGDGVTDLQHHASCRVGRDGVFYWLEDGTYAEAEDMLPADPDHAADLIYYYDLTDDRLVHLSGKSSINGGIHADRFQFLDFDGDGINELFLMRGDDYEPGKFYLCGIRHGGVEQFGRDYDNTMVMPLGYYPGTGLIVSVDAAYNEYYDLVINGCETHLVTKYYQPWEEATYGWWYQGTMIDSLPMQDEEGKALRGNHTYSEDGFDISEAEFNALISSFTNDVGMVSIDEDFFSHFQELSRDNLYQALSLNENNGKTEALADSDLSQCNVGDTVVWGSYEQDNVQSNGKEPIKWIVADKQDGKALLVSCDVLDAQPYFVPTYSGREFINDRNLEVKQVDTNLSKNFERWETYYIVTWEKSDLRKWLNSTFYDTAFTDDEKKKILLSTISTPAHEGKDDGCRDTEDDVFILTYQELEDYGQLTSGGTSDYVSENFGMMSYWLRSNDDASLEGEVDPDKLHNIRLSGNTRAERTDDNKGVRPAIWVST